jgi:zinc transport system substrate-binding protein
MVAMLMAAGCDPPQPKHNEEIIAGTSLIADIIGDLSDARVGAYTLLPSSACPSQFDMKTSDIHRLQTARRVILHPWQMELGNIRRVIEAAKLSTEQLSVLDVPGNWMLPDTQIQAITALATVLRDLFPEQQDRINERAEIRRKRILQTTKEVRQRLNGDASEPVRVLCNEMQAPFASWAGFEVIQTYRRPEDWSVADTEQLVRLGRERQAVLVLDNLQSGGNRMSETLARDIGADHIVLSNFPGGFPDTPTWESAILENTRRIRLAMQHM